MVEHFFYTEMIRVRFSTVLCFFANEVMSEWSKELDCKSIGYCLRWFKSNFPHLVGSPTFGAYKHITNNDVQSVKSDICSDHLGLTIFGEIAQSGPSGTVIVFRNGYCRAPCLQGGRWFKSNSFHLFEEFSVSF